MTNTNGPVRRTEANRLGLAELGGHPVTGMAVFYDAVTGHSHLTARIAVAFARLAHAGDRARDYTWSWLLGALEVCVPFTEEEMRLETS